MIAANRAMIPLIFFIFFVHSCSLLRSRRRNSCRRRSPSWTASCLVNCSLRRMYSSTSRGGYCEKEPSICQYIIGRQEQD
ncbi:hypothetical protein B0H66DRAFT_396918 [Apodospora peruviana]|uniref:Uncharacterized protein n=1 Tax=Apodospora peruviana TaxID=516989 RepID=A0AAE0LYF1_9PEZI|nr:hypothetical protein B0H66DRAFT_396918 [Apodospora peruviana]